MLVARLLLLLMLAIYSLLGSKVPDEIPLGVEVPGETGQHTDGSSQWGWKYVAPTAFIATIICIIIIVWSRPASSFNFNVRNTQPTISAGVSHLGKDSA